jgi:hypothetical protein
VEGVRGNAPLFRALANGTADWQETKQSVEKEAIEIVKSMTDVHEIQRYARQKEISLYGA